MHYVSETSKMGSCASQEAKVQANNAAVIERQLKKDKLHDLITIKLLLLGLLKLFIKILQENNFSSICLYGYLFMCLSI